MQNLTANAIKALQQTPAAAIKWKAWEENGHILLSITDNGPGMSAEKAKTLFDETAISGSRHGLGLHIIRDLAKAINCQLRFTPETGSGTTFILTL
jgi:C4-dicarboxylate-specific signal transduction histidine kinase